MADKKLIDNSSATTVDNFYGNKSGADVQIPLATAASVLAGQLNFSGTYVQNLDKKAWRLTLGNNGLAIVSVYPMQTATRGCTVAIVQEVGEVYQINHIVESADGQAQITATDDSVGVKVTFGGAWGIAVVFPLGVNTATFEQLE